MQNLRVHAHARSVVFVMVMGYSGLVSTTDLPQSVTMTIQSVVVGFLILHAIPGSRVWMIDYHCSADCDQPPRLTSWQEWARNVLQLSLPRGPPGLHIFCLPFEVGDDEKIRCLEQKLELFSRTSIRSFSQEAGWTTINDVLNGPAAPRPSTEPSYSYYVIIKSTTFIAKYKPSLLTYFRERFNKAKFPEN